MMYPALNNIRPFLVDEVPEKIAIGIKSPAPCFRWYPSDGLFMEAYGRSLQRVREAEYAAKEKAVRQALIDHLGYLPTFADVRKWGGCMIFPGDPREHFTWRGEHLLTWETKL